VLKFFPAPHHWADAAMITDGMIWLNGQYLKRCSKGRPSLRQEYKTYCRMLYGRVEKNLAEKPCRAYDLAVFLAPLPPAVKGGKLKTYQQQLTGKPEVQLYVKARKAIDKFIKKHLLTDEMAFEYPQKNGTPEAKEDAEKLYKLYAETPLGEVIRALGNKASPLSLKYVSTELPFVFCHSRTSRISSFITSVFRRQGIRR